MLVSGLGSYTFTFDFSDASNVFMDSMPLQVGYYDGLNGNDQIITGRLSEDLGTPGTPPSVPEPGVFLLFGAGLTGLGLMRRWLKS